MYDLLFIFFLILSQMLPKDVQKKLDERIARAALRGFTREYQNQREDEDNYIR